MCAFTRGILFLGWRFAGLDLAEYSSVFASGSLEPEIENDHIAITESRLRRRLRVFMCCDIMRNGQMRGAVHVRCLGGEPETCWGRIVNVSVEER